MSETDERETKKQRLSDENELPSVSVDVVADTITDDMEQHQPKPTRTTDSVLENQTEHLKKSIENCINAADDFADSRNRSFEGAKVSIQLLLARMEELDNDISEISFQFLLAQNIISCVSEAINGKTGFRNQICSTNDKIYNGPGYTLTKVVLRALKWCLAKKCELCCKQTRGCNCLVNQTMVCCMEYNCSKAKTLKVIQSVVYDWNAKFTECTRISISAFATPSGSQRDQWLRFERLPDAVVTTEMKLDFKSRLLKHATSTAKALEILQAIESTGSSIKLVGKPVKTGPLVWCGIELNEEEIEKIPPNKARGFATENRYGGVVFKFPISATRLGNNVRAFKFGTRKYMYEYSQVLLIPESNSAPHPHTYNNEELIKMEEIDLTKFTWPLDYSAEGAWTHPEMAFAGELEIPLVDLQVYFSDHDCISYRKKDCVDRSDDRDKNCITGTQTEAKFRDLITKQIPGINLVEFGQGSGKHFKISL